MTDVAKTLPFQSAQPFSLGKGASQTISGSSSQSVLCAGLQVIGDIKTDQDLVVSGVVQGNIVSSAKVTVAAGGSVRGGVAGADIIVSGKVEGNILAKQSLTLTSGSSVVGDVETPELVVEAGARVLGKCNMSNSAV